MPLPCPEKCRAFKSSNTHEFRSWFSSIKALVFTSLNHHCVYYHGCHTPPFYSLKMQQKAKSYPKVNWKTNLSQKKRKKKNSISITTQLAISEKLQRVCAPVSKNKKMKYLRVDSWNNAFAISDSKNKGILKICRALTAWTWVSKEHRAGNTSDARSSTQACTLLCLPDSLFLLVDHGKIQSLVKYFHRIPPLKDNF